jgi:hypothetical protein
LIDELQELAYCQPGQKHHGLSIAF